MFLAQALIHLCGVNDTETQSFALQSLELLAIDSPETICAQIELIPVLLAIPHNSVDIKMQTLTAKLLIYFSESQEVRFQCFPMILMKIPSIN